MMKKIHLFFPFLLLLLFTDVQAQHSMAREWNEALLHAIRNDYARPTVHARNLWHTSIAMYDAWAAYEDNANNYLLGQTVDGFSSPFSGVTVPTDKKAAQQIAINYACYRLIRYRFRFSPNYLNTIPHVDSVFFEMGGDSSIHSTNYAVDGPAALGNYIASEIIRFGNQDEANEQLDYINNYYNPINPTLYPALPGNPDIADPNRWQPLTLDVFIDQAGNPIPLNTPEFLSPEWGNVTPFAMDANDRQAHVRNGDTFWVYHNPPPPPYIDTTNGGTSTDNYMWGFSLVAKWSSHLDTTDGVMWDISPASIGNVQWYPSTFDSFPQFYDANNGGDIGTGYSVNPATGMPYAPQLVPRGDYARVLAEFWADGPDSETPPGHWFTIINYVHDHPQFERRWRGGGPLLDTLEWDVKAYFSLGGAMHDAAITAWGCKGWYDYLRPISAIRYMADQGQSTNPSLPSYDISGIPLEPGLIELVDSLDPLAGDTMQHVGKIKLLAWAGPDSIGDPHVDMAGVKWILAENWWPYQRPSFVTPPFAGYVSGHSTYSRAAAEVLTMITGDPYFPGGMGEFHALEDSFLVFEEGPSMDVTLQWATYRDASDQCSLSRIWGGIHPPADDIPGRLMGITVGQDAYEKARTYWEDDNPDVIAISTSVQTIVNSISQFTITVEYNEDMLQSSTPNINFPVENPQSLTPNASQSGWTNAYTYEMVYDINNQGEVLMDIDVQVDGAVSATGGFNQDAYTKTDVFNIDMTSNLEELAGKNFQLFPNPVQKGKTVLLKGMENVNQIQIVDVNGRILRTIAAPDAQYNLSTEDLEIGTYFIQIQKNKQQQSYKLVIKP